MSSDTAVLSGQQLPPTTIPTGQLTAVESSPADETTGNNPQNSDGKSAAPFPPPPAGLKRLFEVINASDDPTAVEQVLLVEGDATASSGGGGVSLVHAHDEHGLTPLHQAAYRGRVRVCGALLDRGASVNSQQHEHGYTPLHFAALSGNVDTVRRLLSAGADPKLLNSVGRTASQMAGFVGNHKLVTVIASYVPRTLIDRYTVVRKQQKRALLPPHLAPPTHQLLLDTNLHPVHVLLWACSGVGDGCDVVSSDLMTSRLMHAADISATLTQISERYVQKQLESDSGELVAIKAHYLARILSNIDEQLKQQQQQKHKELSPEEQQHMCQQLARKWLRSPKASNNKSTAQPPFFDALIRQCIKSFEHRELPAFRTLVTAVVHGGSSSTATAPDSGGVHNPSVEGHSEVLQVLSTTVNCQSGFGIGAGDGDSMCATCCEPNAVKVCSVCRSVSYCDRRCQKIHWPLHRDRCGQAGSENVTARGRALEIVSGSEIDSQSNEKSAVAHN